MIRYPVACDLSRRALALLVAAALAAAFLAVSPARAQDVSDLTVRTGRLENLVRQLSGQIEQLQFENRRLSEQLRKFQEDVDFRLSERGGAGSRPPAEARPPRQRQSDAFDPSAQPGSAGAPRQLGGGIGGIIEKDFDSDGGQGPLDLQGVGRTPQGALPPPVRGGPSVAATGGVVSPRQAYDLAYASILRKEYEQAEMGFRQFLQNYPREALAADATYWLGESYFQRRKYREAAEQFLKISRDFPRAGKAPDGLLRLGMALNGLGAREQACATYAKLGVDYPAASNGVRQGVERERRRAGCA